MIILKLVLFLYESNDFAFTLRYWVGLYYIKTKIKTKTRNCNAFTVPREKTFTALWQFLEKLYLQFTILWKTSKIISLTFFRMKNIAVFHAQSRYLAKLICGIAFISTSSAWSMAVPHVLFELRIKKIV